MTIVEKPDNLVDLFETAVDRFAGNPLFGTRGKDGQYHWMTYGEAGQRAAHLRSGLAGLGIVAGDAVGIIANNRAEWAITAFAAYGCGARHVPMYENELPKIWQYIINDSRVKVLLVPHAGIRDQIRALSADLPDLEQILVIDGEGDDTMAALEKKGAARPVPAVHPAPDDIAALVYTSGTTGAPKGVLLSHHNFITNARAGARLYPQLCQTSRSISILPWAHSFGQTAELYNWFQFGGSIGFMESVATLGDDMAAVRPTFIIAVPRVFNKIYNGLWAKMEETGGLARKLFTMGVEAGKKRRDLADQGRRSFWTDLKFKVADRVVFEKIRQRFGGRLQGALTGSATMNPEIAHFFFDLGIPVYDCYGLSETSPAITMNSPDDYRLGTVGKPIENVRVVIDPSAVPPGSPDGEIVAYGPNVMQGYHNKPEATADVITSDGGFRTGDRGWIDEDGFLHITGRLKEQYKLENGKYVFPAALEEDIKLCPYIENTMVYGEGRAYNICLVVPDFAALGPWAESRGLPIRPREMVESPEICTFLTETVTSLLKGRYGGYEIPKKFVFLAENFTTENGLITQTMKLKRSKVMDRYREALEAQYR